MVVGYDWTFREHQDHTFGSRGTGQTILAQTNVFSHQGDIPLHLDLQRLKVVGKMENVPQMVGFMAMNPMVESKEITKKKQTKAECY